MHKTLAALLTCVYEPLRMAQGQSFEQLKWRGVLGKGCVRHCMSLLVSYVKHFKGIYKYLAGVGSEYF